MSRSLLHDWEHAIDRCCRDDNPKEMISIAEDIYNTAYARGKNHSIEVKEVLDKIKAEISTVYESLDGYDPDSLGAFVSKIDEIFDKYKTESEDT